MPPLEGRLRHADGTTADLGLKGASKLSVRCIIDIYIYVFKYNRYTYLYILIDVYITFALDVHLQHVCDVYHLICV